MARKRRKCICCNTTYDFCPTCWDDRLKPAWMVEFCCEDCKDIWETATKFNMQLITKEEAKEKIESLNLKPHTEYVECVQRDLKNILEEPKQEQKQPKVEPKVKAQKADMKQFKKINKIYKAL